ncbi:MAG: PAS domain-containing protein, partial [Syntrophales bacterium LBB04]|nr:PAS domain-containing protein [Syntrophales bacterium LBB04]
MTTISGDKRVVTYYKMRLFGEQSPYMYIRAGIPIATVMADANKVLIRNLAIFISFLVLAVYFAWLIGKRSIADRVTLLENASRNLADGVFLGRVSELVAGGELGRLAQTFDAMAHQLSLREQAMLESEDRLWAAINVSQIGIFDHNQRTDTIYWSPQQRVIHGWDPDESITLQAFLDLVHPEDRESIVASIRLAHDPAGDGIWDVEHRIIRPDGAVRWLKERSQTFFDGDGGARRPVRTIGAVLGITERKHAQEEKQKLQVQLLQVQKMESVGQLASGIAHDFNNILGAIIGYGSLIQWKILADDPSRVYVDQILAAAERAAGLTKSLLAFSRKQVIDPKNVDLNESIRKVERFLSRIISEDIALMTFLSTEALTVFVDPTQIEQILLNLATNARDAMPNSGKLIIETERVEFDNSQAVTHSFGKPGPYAVMSVTDTGSGIDDQTKNKIFEPFFT